MTLVGCGMVFGMVIYLLVVIFAFVGGFVECRVVCIALIVWGYVNSVVICVLHVCIFVGGICFRFFW